MESRFNIIVKPNGSSLTPARVKKIIKDHIAAAGGSAEVTEAAVRGRPPLDEPQDETLTVRLTSADLTALDRIVHDRKTNRAAVVRSAIRREIEESEAKKENSEKSTEPA